MCILFLPLLLASYMAESARAIYLASGNLSSDLISTTPALECAGASAPGLYLGVFCEHSPDRTGGGRAFALRHEDDEFLAAVTADQIAGAQLGHDQ